MDTLADMASERKALRFELDALSDIVVNASSVSFRHEIRTLRAHETFCETPRDVMERTASLLDADIIDGVARTVHDTVTVAIGCNRVPLFALVEGGRARTLFTFRCVYDGCPAFMDIRTFVGQWRVKWIIVCISHTHAKGKRIDWFEPFFKKQAGKEEAFSKTGKRTWNRLCLLRILEKDEQETRKLEGRKKA